MSALSNSFLRSILLFSFNQDLLLFGKFSVFKMFVLNKTRKCEGMRRNSTPFLFWMTKQHSLNSLSSSFQGQFIQKVVSFHNNQVNNEYSPFLNGKEYSSLFLYSHQGQHFQPFLLLFSFPLTFILFMWRISIPIIILPFQFIRFFSLPSFVSNLNHLHRINGVYSCVFLWTSF